MGKKKKQEKQKKGKNKGKEEKLLKAEKSLKSEKAQKSEKTPKKEKRTQEDKKKRMSFEAEKPKTAEIFSENKTETAKASGERKIKTTEISGTGKTKLTDLSETEMAEALRALGDESRMQILTLLLEGEKCAGDLLQSLPIVQSTLSHHMGVLVEHDLVHCRKQGKWSYYRINSEKLAAISAYVMKWGGSNE